MYQEMHEHIGQNIILCGNYNLQLDNKDRALRFAKRNTYLDNVRTLFPVIHQEKTDLNVVEGDLVLFAPTQSHFVPRACEKHDGYRITISFNVRSS